MTQFGSVPALQPSESCGVTSELTLRFARAARRAAGPGIGRLLATDDAADVDGLRGVHRVDGFVTEIDGVVPHIGAGVANVDAHVIGRCSKPRLGNDDFRCHAGSFDRDAIRHVPEPAS